MSERIDRRAGAGRVLLWALIITFTALAAGGVYVWSRLSAPPAIAEPQGRTSITQPLQLDALQSITLFYPVDGMLAPATAAVKRQPDTQAAAAEALAALFTEQQAQPFGLFSAVKLRAFFLDGSGTAYVDLSPASPDGLAASAWD